MLFTGDSGIYKIGLFNTGIYEIIPGFFCGMLAAVLVSLISKKPSQEVLDLFALAKKPIDVVSESTKEMTSATESAVSE